MLTKIDERNGLVKVYWSDVRDRVNKILPHFAAMVDKLSPDKTFPLYLAYYPYGELKGDTVSPILPKTDGGSYRLTDPNVPKEVLLNLGYGNTSSPLGMLLEKTLEYFIDLKNLQITIPWQIFSPGAFFPLSRFMQNKSNRIYTPNGLLTAVSGSRSVFMLPKIGCSTHHLMLRKNYNVQPQPPKTLYEHWNLFKEITKCDKTNTPWRSCVLYFSKKWIDKIHTDNAWSPIKKFLLELAWNSSEYGRNHIYYNIAYSLIQNYRNLKPNPYLTDTACHLFTVALGAVPGYAPICDNELLPLDIIQKAFVEGYGLKKYIPTIIAPHHFVFENSESKPVYYSLQYPSTLSFSPKSRKISSTLFEMRELQHIINIFQTELTKESNIFSDTVICDVAKNVKFNFFHNQNDIHSTIEDSNKIIDYDKRFSRINFKNSDYEPAFASDAPFIRGCVGIGLKN